MGRGRAKAKQTKVARKLKYQTLDTDLNALQRELAGSSEDDDGDGGEEPDYSSWADDEGDYDLSER